MNKELMALSCEWWERLRPLCRKFARETYLYGYSQEDLMQECYLQLVKCLEKFDSSLEVPFESYYKIQLYGWRSNQNRKKREFLSQQQESNDEITQQIDEEADTQKQVERKCFYEAVMKELRHMQPTEQTLVIGYYLQNKSLKELAKVMGINYKTAEFRKGKALRQLKILLSSYQ